MCIYTYIVAALSLLNGLLLTPLPNPFLHFVISWNLLAARPRLHDEELLKSQPVAGPLDVHDALGGVDVPHRLRVRRQRQVRAHPFRHQIHQLAAAGQILPRALSRV